ncbi:MAG: UDP-N-acetylmuramate:L-alanyl-gamma-D-glutamyl-meso-diaminopimelate ligase, partial [Pseudomonadota bacterium]|nr:UDP-N-acetylmuramate:L-alanyl-gamma-D-glutamyl-meso-diaminopimelate ligase [Pseudomonadota bacterium]
LKDEFLRERRNLVVTGTHGKTTTASMLAHLLQSCGIDPGYMIGGIARDLGQGCRFSDSEFFVLEGDEYDTAFFDKRSKFIHYHPDIAVLTNLEFDHADIFNSIEDIERQFHHLIRTVPPDGRLIVNGDDSRLVQVLSMGCWTPVEFWNTQCPADDDWQVETDNPGSSRFTVSRRGSNAGTVVWNLFGLHNLSNGVAAVAAAAATGIPVTDACEALASFKLPGRRLELVSHRIDGTRLFDDFAHHPSAIAATLKALRQQTSKGRLIAVIDPRSNTMKLGIHLTELSNAIRDADITIVFKHNGLHWDPAMLAPPEKDTKLHVLESALEILNELKKQVRPGDTVVLMSNGSFDGVRTGFSSWMGASGCE